jgi:lipopolysaccharide transport system ATP-binding protein
MSSDEIAIRVQDLSKCYHIYDRPQDRLKQSLLPRVKRLLGWPFKAYYREFWALRDVSFEVKKGEAVGIIGRNGSGKSTLLQIIAGTLQRTNGTMHLNGRVAALLELGSGFNPEFTGRENVFLNGAVLGIPSEEMERLFDPILAFADIGDFIDQPVKTYSSGMLVRLAFAVSVNVRPDILIIDEALSVGDAAFQFKCLHRLEELTQSGATLLFVSHSMELVRTFCKRVVYLKQGKPHAIGTPEEVAELYLMDIRDERNRNLSPQLSVKKKAAFAEEAVSSFGTDQGRILSAAFEGDRQSTILFFGDQQSGHIDVEYDSSVQDPCLVMVIQDVKGLNIGGAATFLPRQKGASRRRIRLGFHFKVLFFFGTYFVTFRLEDRRTKEINFLVEKQTGILSFEVMRAGKELTVGTVDLGVNLEPIC